MQRDDLISPFQLKTFFKMVKVDGKICRKKHVKKQISSQVNVNSSVLDLDFIAYYFKV